MGIRGWGATAAEAFEEAAAAMFSVMADVEGAEPTRSAELRCTAVDLESLLVEFLNAALARCDLEGTIPLRAEVGRLERRGESWALEARVSAASVAESLDRLLTEVKAATYYGALVRETAPGEWEARCVIDL